MGRVKELLLDNKYEDIIDQFDCHKRSKEKSKCSTSRKNVEKKENV